MWPFRRYRQKRVLRESLIPEPLWQDALAVHPIVAGFDDADCHRLRELATLFIDEKLFEPVLGIELNDGIRTTIALQACLPILNLGIDWYRDWRTIVVYPAEFVKPRQEADPIGVMHEWEEILGGESWERGPVILSWADVEASGWADGYNVVIHEMAHKLDMLNGDADGFPPLHRDMRAKEWTAVFSGAFMNLNQRLDRGDPVPIDPYAAEAPAEFFAVLSEYFFEQPEAVLALYPAAYEKLAEFYRQDPFSRADAIQCAAARSAAVARPCD